MSYFSLLFVFNTEALIRYGGLAMFCLLVYGSTGLFFCFMIPSGAVLFAAGIYAVSGELSENIVIICILLIGSSIFGNMTGYWFGKKAGPALYRRKDSRFFKQHYLVKTGEFYGKYGKLALIAGFFLPIIRTFSPVLAGIVRMDFRRFIISTTAGSVLWIASFVMAGYFIAKQPLLKPWLKYIAGGFILVVTVPLVIRIIRELKRPNETKD